MNEHERSARAVSPIRFLARLRSGNCVLRSPVTTCSASQLRGGLFLANLAFWALVVFLACRALA